MVLFPLWNTIHISLNGALIVDQVNRFPELLINVFNGGVVPSTDVYGVVIMEWMDNRYADSYLRLIYRESINLIIGTVFVNN